MIFDIKMQMTKRHKKI